jgi:hypothetical protein
MAQVRSSVLRRLPTPNFPVVSRKGGIAFAAVSWMGSIQCGGAALPGALNGSGEPSVFQRERGFASCAAA